MSGAQFEDEYDLDKLQAIKPQKGDFQMLVTPRFVSSYGEGKYEDFTAALLLAYSKDNMLFIDAGAHYGYYTLLVGTRQPNCKVIAFEPVPENFAILQRNVALNNLKNVELCNLAVSDSDGLRKFKIMEASDSCGFHEHPLTSTSREIEVQTVCLDKFLKKLPKVPIVIKIDAEGHEPYILRGMKKLLQDTEDVKLIIEFNPRCLRKGGHEPSGFLEEIAGLGFDIYVIDDGKRLTYKLSQDSFPKWRVHLLKGDENLSANMLCVKKPQSLSVLFFSHSSQLVGAERSLLGLVQQLIADHGAVCTVVLPYEGPLKTRLEAAGAATLIIDYHWWCDPDFLPPEEARRRLSDSFKNVLSNLPELGKINPDVVFTSTLVIPWGAVAASFLGRPHVWSIQEFGEIDHNLKFQLPFPGVLNVIKDTSNLILTNSHAVKQALFGEAPPENVLTIFPHIDIPAEALQGDEPDYFDRLQAVRLIIFGTIHESKGQKDAILAVKELVRRKRDVELVIMGYASHPYLEKLTELVNTEGLEPYVKFVDFRENHYPAVKQADIILVCSRVEALGHDREMLRAVQDHCRRGEVDSALRLLGQAAGRVPITQAKEIRHVSKYIKANADGLKDYRENLAQPDSAWCRTGAIEGNVDKLIVRRMKNQGMSWSLQGIRKMLWLRISLCEDKLQERLCSPRDENVPVTLPEKMIRRVIDRTLKYDYSDYFRATMPALSGPHSSRPWVEMLKSLTRIAV